jgi:TolB-like protein/serine/threonine protein kinase/Flp pilus assembly protein TadD
VSTATQSKSDPARWQRLKNILADALEQTSAEKRTATLREACGDDAALLHDAEKLLAQDTAVFEEFAQFAATRLRRDEGDRAGERVGAYALIGELGRGGMGAVYLAERADGQFQKRVAVKVLKRGTDTDEVLRRFRTERQILANLDHPNITRLLDAGTTTDGLPYLVMEFVEGTPITQFIQRQKVRLLGRLKLFLKMCSAVEFAHRYQVIHRDIKPGNVLVSEDGNPKLLDFGIAKVLNVDSDDGITTVVAERRLTPAYAAPEQNEGQCATIATDVYSLGALLYELLTDKPPRRKSNGEGARHKISEYSAPPQLPSEAVADLERKSQLQGQLDQIVARATQRDPAKRYSSVANLSEDIERYLNGASFLAANAQILSGAEGRFETGFRRRLRIAATSAVILGVIVVGAAAFLRGPGIHLLQNQENKKPIPTESPGTALEAVRSIAVLPFEPIGQGMNDQLLGLGMADAVIGRMSRLKGLTVLPTSSISKYKGPANDPIAAGRALGVDAILSGTAQRSGDRIRVTVQLVQVASGRTLWSEKIDQTFTEIFEVQDAISDNVARSLALNLTIDEQKQLRKRYTTNPAAYDSYLMGLYFWNTRSKEGLEKAIDYFSRAVEKDPNFALAYALMSDCYFLQLYYGYDSRPDRIRDARTAVERALLLDDSLAEAHVALAGVQFREKMGRRTESDQQEGIDSLRRAITLNPNLAIAHQRYAWALSSFGHLDESVREMKRAQELDPLSATNNTALGISFVFARRYREALDYCYRAAELAPTLASVQSNLGFAYTLNGMYEQAIVRYQKVRELDPSAKGDALAAIATALVSAGRASEADSLMPEILKLAEEGKADPYYIVALYTVRGEKDAAFAWFERALQSGPQVQTNAKDVRTLRYDPMLDPLRSDSRFAALLRRYNWGSLLETATRPAGTNSADASTVRSIAVLPFEPLGKDMHDELLGLGMADAVISKLSTLRQLIVLPTCAVSRYKGPASDPLAAGRTLGVDAILSGTVQRSGDRVRTTVQLAHVPSGRTIWSDKFDQTFTDIFGIQDSISESVAKSLALNLSADERKQLAKRYTTSASAYDEYLMGLYFWNTRSKDGLEKAIGHFSRAVEKDPNFALAYALMSDCYYLQLIYRYDSRPDRIQSARAAAERALLLDDSIAEGHVAMAMVRFYEKDHQPAESDHQAEMDSLRRAIALNSNLAIAHQRYAWALAAFGHLEDSLREARHAQELDPLSPTNNAALGMTLVFSRQYPEALEYFHKAAELAPDLAPVQNDLAFAYTLNGMYKQAIEHYQKVRELNPAENGNVLTSIAAVLVSDGRKSKADSMMAEILKLAEEGKVDPYDVAALYAIRGEKDAAFEWFARALQSNSERQSNGNDSRTIRYDPMLDPLRTDTRFAKVLRQHNLASLLDAPARH